MSYPEAYPEDLSYPLLQEQEGLALTPWIPARAGGMTAPQDAMRQETRGPAEGRGSPWHQPTS